MDDIILLHKSKEQLKQNTKEITIFLQDLGWQLSMKKCMIYPKTTFNYLGWKFNTCTMEVQMTPERRRMMKKNLKDWITKTNLKQIVRIKSLASLIGEINFIRVQFPAISLWMNSLNHLKTKAVSKGTWKGQVKLNNQIQGNLQAILSMVKLNKPLSLKELTPDTVLTTDASEEGWGMTLVKNQSEIWDAGEWQKGWHLTSSNQRELAA
ncbi:MAG: hypothetical protein EZS28_042593, partial [Streblomastix strix]